MEQTIMIVKSYKMGISFLKLLRPLRTVSDNLVGSGPTMEFVTHARLLSL